MTSTIQEAVHQLEQVVDRIGSFEGGGVNVAQSLPHGDQREGRVTQLPEAVDGATAKMSGPESDEQDAAADRTSDPSPAPGATGGPPPLEQVPPTSIPPSILASQLRNIIQQLERGEPGTGAPLQSPDQTGEGSGD